MSVRLGKPSLCRRALAPALGTLCLASSAVLGAQSTNLPSNPNPNPSSLSNPYFGSVTLTPLTDGVIKLSLDESVQRGLKANLGLKENEQNEKVLHGELNEALQYFLPTIDLSGSTGYNEYNLAAFGFGPGVLSQISQLFPGQNIDIKLITKVDVTRAQLNYEQTIFSGPVLDGYKAVRAAQTASYYAKMTARGEVVQQVATAYLAVIADRSDVANAKSLLDSDKVLLDQAHAKHEAGTVANLDDLRARVQYQQQEQTVTASEARLVKAEILLKREIGIAPGQKIELTDPTPYNELAARTIEDLRTVAYANRKDYHNLQAQLRETQMVLGARRAERFPSLSFKGNYGVTEVSGVGSHGTLNAVGTLSFPIFEEGTLRGDKDVAKAQLQGTQLQLDDLRAHIDTQIRTALLDVHAAAELVQVARSNEDLARQALSDESDRFKAGVDDTLPLTQAQSTLASAQSSLVQSLYQFNVAKLALARSLGILEEQYRDYLGK